MRWLFLVCLPLLLAACDEHEDKVPPPVTPDREAVTYFGGMILVDHLGPKAQVHLESTDQPLWFPSVTDAKAFTLLPGEPKDITAIYVTDMTEGEWEHPSGWLAADKATYVIASDARGGMGQPEAVPFSDQAAAESFAKAHGGRLVDWEGIPEDYVIGENAGSARPCRRAWRRRSMRARLDREP